jgi:hypothetical protein
MEIVVKCTNAWLCFDGRVLEIFYNNNNMPTSGQTSTRYSIRHIEGIAVQEPDSQDMRLLYVVRTDRLDRPIQLGEFAPDQLDEVKKLGAAITKAKQAL